MDRRHLLRSTGVVAGLLSAGCLGGVGSSIDPSQAGSGHPCDDPRNIDYDAVDADVATFEIADATTIRVTGADDS